MPDKQDVESALSPQTLTHPDHSEDEAMTARLSPEEIRDLLDEWMG